MDKEKLVEQANIYKAGDSDVEHNEADFWLWRNENRSNNIEFVLKLSDDQLTCMDSEELWSMSPALAESCKVIGISEGYCPECPFLDKCSKHSEVGEINSSVEGNKKD